MSAQQKKLLEKQLWAVANLLRGKMNADSYKDYILGFIFYKFLSEKQEKYADDILKGDNIKFIKLDEDNELLKDIEERSLESLGYFIKPKQLFSFIVAKGNKELGDDDSILDDLKDILQDIEGSTKERESEEDFAGLFEDMDLDSSKLGKTYNARNKVIVEVLTKLSEIDFAIEDSNSDVLGDAYEYMIANFAEGAGKKAGEFYTPQQISELISRIVTHNKKRIKAVYDPTCGSGSLLLRIGKKIKVNDYYGQENNPSTYNLARMNMLLHDVHFRDFDIRHGDTLTDDQLPDLRADAVVANPPFSLEWKGKDDANILEDERFSEYGEVAPKNKADFAFVTHMLYHLADDGTLAVVLPHGVLFRSGAEGKIRKHIIENKNYLDAVIGLPSNLFFGVSIPAIVAVFKKDRSPSDSVLLIDASKEFEKGKNQNILTDQNLQKIFETYISRKEVEKYSHNADLAEIKENDFNLNIPRYVDTFEEEEQIDIEQVAKELQKLQKDEKGVKENIAGFCEELGIDKPFE